MKTTSHYLPIAGAACLLFAFAPLPSIRASDHADGPTVAADQGADIGDQYVFLDPNDNTKVVLIGDVRGFIVPGENNNFGVFDPGIRYTFAIENTGDFIPDLFIDINFTERKIVPPATTPSQEAIISFRGAVPEQLRGKKGTFTAPVSPTSISETVAPAQVVTSLSNAANPTPSIKFFAGETDDPFFFDGPAFSYFVSAVKDNKPNPTQQLTRGRDTFAGYNTMSIAIEMPAALLLNKRKTTTIGVSSVTARQTDRIVNGVDVGSGPWQTLDRAGVPGVNVLLIPYNDRNSYNDSTQDEYARGKFYNDLFGPKSIFAALGTDAAHLAILKSVIGVPAAGPARTRREFGSGDYLRLDTTKPNNGLGAAGDGSNANGFPNGRRLGDDVVATIIFVASNGGITTGDNVPANDRAFEPEFPFLATPNMPLPSGTDPTKN